MERKINSYICEKCGAQFNSVGIKKVILCRNCKREYDTELTRKRRKKSRLEKRNPVKVKKSSKSISAICREMEIYNKEHNTCINYGEFVNLMGY